jgi:hypothetical protein
VACGSSEAGFETLGRTWGVCIFTCWARKGWRVTFNSVKLLSRHRIQASASEMGESSVAMGLGGMEAERSSHGVPKLCRKARSYLKKGLSAY